MLNVIKGNQQFDLVWQTVLEDLKQHHGARFDPRQVTCELERTGPNETSFSISYRKKPAIWATLDMTRDRWKMQYKRFSQFH